MLRIQSKNVKNFFAPISLQNSLKPSLGPHRKFQLNIFKTVGVVCGMTNKVQENRKLLYIMVQRISDTLEVLLGKSYFIRRKKCS